MIPLPPTQLDASNISEFEAQSIRCYRDHTKHCLGARCMAWRWHGDGLQKLIPPRAKPGGSVGTSTHRTQKDWPEPEDDGKGSWTWVEDSYTVGKAVKEGPLGRWLRPLGDRRTGYCGPCEARIAEVEVEVA